MTPKAPQAMSLIETVVSLGIVSGLVVVFGISLVAVVSAQKVQWRNMATALADEQLAVLQTYSSGTVAAQTNGSLIGVLFPQGAWAVAADATAPSQPNALALTATGSATGVTAVQPFPNNAYADFTQATSLKVLPTPPSGWRAGLMFRAADLNNHYRAYVTATSLVLERVVGGTATVLFSDVRTVSTGTWHQLSVTSTGSSISVSLNGTLVTTQNDATFSIGKSALFAWNSASVNFDNPAMSGYVWNLDATETGTIPTDWLRFGLSDLPLGVGTLTVTTLYGDDSVKKYDVTISWNEKGGTKSVTHTSISTN